jgi:ferritin-like metal-binding protein YciE
LEETKAQVERLNRVFASLGQGPDDTVCEAALGLIKEGDDIVTAAGDPNVKDAALIGMAQRVEHYEMAAYGTACALAKQLGLDDVAELLHRNLEEEKATDEKLTKLAKGGIFSAGINQAAAANSPC